MSKTEVGLIILYSASVHAVKLHLLQLHLLRQSLLLQPRSLLVDNSLALQSVRFAHFDWQDPICVLAVVLTATQALVGFIQLLVRLHVGCVLHSVAQGAPVRQQRIARDRIRALVLRGFKMDARFVFLLVYQQESTLQVVHRGLFVLLVQRSVAPLIVITAVQVMETLLRKRLADTGIPRIVRYVIRHVNLVQVQEIQIARYAQL